MVTTRLLLKDNANNRYKYIIGAIHAQNGKQKGKFSEIFN